MNKFNFNTALLFIILLGTGYMAYTPAVIGGIRNGTSLGLMFENISQINNIDINVGIEASTSGTPVIIFVGGKWFLRDVNNTKLPMFLNLGLVAYLGDNATVGPYVSIILERFLEIPDLFLEFGIDIVSSGKFQAQIGYYF